MKKRVEKKPVKRASATKEKLSTEFGGISEVSEVGPGIEEESSEMPEVQSVEITGGLVEKPIEVIEKPVTPQSIEEEVPPQVDASEEELADEAYKAEMEKIFEDVSNELKPIKDDFDALTWLRSYRDKTGEYAEEVYQDLIKEVEKRYSSKDNITKEDYLSFFNLDESKNPYTSKLGNAILDIVLQEKLIFQSN